ncbi:GNAT family N-acetyltransferase [Aeromicrobium sp. CF3.5]|uniref:GNAT family N-acetyltransferase n=1 Tax=Aeromicrobium sp. CF3.5 TaxID=3373078 RepID=UPI003EE53A22
MRPAPTRLATAADLAALLAIETDCFGDGAWSGPTILRSIEDPLQEVLLSTRGDAYGIIRVVADTADLDRIATLAPVRGQGLGRAVLQALTDRAISRGAQRMLLEVSEDNTSARALYDAVGFTEIHRRRRYYRGGADALVMERGLPIDRPLAR